MNYMHGSPLKPKALAKRKSSLADAVHGAARADNRSRPTRDDMGAKKGILLRLDPELHRQLRQLALDDGTSLQELGVSALQQLLRDRQERSFP